jgi:uncharacterized membrane protein
MDDPRDRFFKPPPEQRPRRMPVYDVLWKRVTQAVGLLIAVVEFTVASAAGRPVDQNVLLFAAMLIGLPLAARRGGGGT